MAILVLICVAVLVVGIAALVIIPVKHLEVVLVDLYWKRAMLVGAPHWEKRESPRKPRGEVRKVVNLNAEDPEKKPLWAFEERVWEGLHWIRAEDHDQRHLRWPEDKVKGGEAVKRKSELYQATFLANEAGRYAKSLSQRRWERRRRPHGIPPTGTKQRSSESSLRRPCSGRPVRRDWGGRWILAGQFLTDLRRIDVLRRNVQKKLATAVRASGTTVTETFGVGPAVAAAVLDDIRDISRFADPDSFAACNATAPVEVSSGGRVVPAVAAQEPPG